MTSEFLPICYRCGKPIIWGQEMGVVEMKDKPDDFFHAECPEVKDEHKPA